ncbi:mechanosensitive ion channel [Sphingomonas sp. So64.6b]|uniref:mechanosensitive ion channel family protein n=1 Tax=Sphingomonas sp. So64.6b TaxID=2997354 RepID=UPI0016027AD1|nr:mechanosensitive ion channel domain-containing protein [Sphingomonas sp. So64.6b]QNA83933.1 mechanosensitive ion channel [Sphingomonas sp. So64.6b]
MQWREWLAGLGLPIPQTLGIEPIVVAALLVVGAYWLGWIIAARATPSITRALLRWTERADDASGKLVKGLIHYSIMALILIVAGNVTSWVTVALMIVALGLGFALAMLVYRIGRTFGLGMALASILALAVFVATAAGTLGGLRPMIDALDGIGFNVGSRRISMLGLVNFILVAAILFVLARLINRILVHSIARLTHLDISQRVLVQKLGGIAVIMVAVLLGIDLLGIDLTALAVFSGAIGLAVGFGLQKTFGNLMAGLILLMDRSVKPGDVIVVGDTFGAVTKIGIRAVSVVTRDGKEHLIPNETLMTEPVENWSYSSRNVRIHIPIGVSHSSDILLAQKLMLEAAFASDRVLADPAPRVWLKAFGESSIDHEILAWIADPEGGVGGVRSEILNRLLILFRDNQIVLPFPQRDVNIRSEQVPDP